jgi:hypothetical protein
MRKATSRTFRKGGGLSFGIAQNSFCGAGLHLLVPPNAHGPPKAKKTGALLHAPIPNLRLRAVYAIATLLVKILDAPFWRAAQWRGRLADQIDNERSEQ